MSWDRIALCGTDVLGLALVVRLLALRLHHVYKVFCLYLLFNLFCSTVSFFSQLFAVTGLDYRLYFLMVSGVIWVLTVWMIYALLSAMLAHLPGILKFSRKLLNASFVAAVLIALLTLKVDPAAARDIHVLKSLNGAVAVSLLIEQVISTVALVALLTIAAFVLWFPVQMPRNLVFFSLGFVVNFACEVGLLFARGLESWDIDAINFSVSTACFAYWAININRAGELAPVRIGHRWQKEEQDRLIQQLESVNIALLRSIRDKGNAFGNTPGK